MLGGFSFHVSEACLIALICEVLIFFLRIMQVRLDRLELIKEPSQFKTYSLRGNTKAKGSFFGLCNFFFLFYFHINCIVSRNSQVENKKIGDWGLRCLEMILSCNNIMYVMEESQWDKATQKHHGKVKAAYIPIASSFWAPFLKSRTKITYALVRIIHVMGSD